MTYEALLFEDEINDDEDSNVYQRVASGSSK